MIESDRTVTRSFRISETSLKVLQEEAQSQNISVNTLVNQIILSYTNFDKYAKKFSFIRLSSIVLRYLLEAMPDEVVIRVSYNAGKEVSEPFILAKHGILNLETALEYLRSLSFYANLFEYNEVDKDEKKIITLMHTLGSKGSLFIGHFIQPIFERIGVNACFSLSDHAVVIGI